LSALISGFLICSTAILSVILGILGAYCAINALLAALNPSTNRFAALVPHHTQASGD
jgi:hypothetical protein